MRHTFYKRKMLSALCSAALLTGMLANVPMAAADNGRTESDGEVRFAVRSMKENGYDQYLAKHEGADRPQRVIRVEAEHYIQADGMTPRMMEDGGGSAEGAVLTDETGKITWEIDVPETGLYNIGIRYLNVEGKSSEIERALYIDGQIPFSEAGGIFLQRAWKHEKDEMEKDRRGNEIRPSHVEEHIWREVVLRDLSGYYEEPYFFYFSKGRHTLSLESIREPAAIDCFFLFQAEKPIDYQDQLTIYKQQGYRNAGKDIVIKVQGENAALKSSPTLYPIMDRSPNVEPYHVSLVRMNAIGGYNWRLPGQWLEWEVEIPEDGLYQIAFKSKQSFSRGMGSTRTLLVDGKVPFREAERITFDFSTDWTMKVVGEPDGDPYLFYFSKGKHRLRLEVSLGELSPLLRTVESCILELNALYRKIISFTGVVPDPYRDYQLEQRIPELKEALERQSGIISGIARAMEGYEGKTSDRTALLKSLAYQLKDMSERPETVPTRLEKFKTNVGALSAWMFGVKEQPLTIDYLIVASPEAKLPRAKATFWEKLFHEIRKLIASFFTDYEMIGEVAHGKNALTVWVTTGRDQAQILKRMIDNEFSPAYGIPVNLQLVPGDVLLSATLAGQGPDVAIQVGNDVPVNFAMRSALQDLSEFPDFAHVIERFHPSALVPYQYNGGVYALPEQQIFPMLFYRKDILEQLNIGVPQTWDDVYSIIPVLQKNNLQFGLPQQTVESAGTGVTQQLPPNPAYAMMLYQNDGEFYRNGGTSSALDTEPAIQAFRKWTELYANYKLPIVFDFPNRFRTGEMPVGIADYVTYNHLRVSAPEIRGLWDIAPVPGTKTANGEIRRDAASKGFGAILFKNAADKEAAWEFLKWWTGEAAQLEFGREMEGLMGPAGRYPTANLEAFEQLPWTKSERDVLTEQWKWVRGIPEVPGGYFTGRHLDNAFRRVVLQGDDARETMDLYVRYINEEIAVKRKEFNLPLEK